MTLVNIALGLDPDAPGEQTIEAVHALVVRDTAARKLKEEIADLRLARARAIINRLSVKLDLNEELAIQGALIREFDGTVDLLSAVKGALGDDFRAGLADGRWRRWIRR